MKSHNSEVLAVALGLLFQPRGELRSWTVSIKHRALATPSPVSWVNGTSPGRSRAFLGLRSPGERGKDHRAPRAGARLHWSLFSAARRAPGGPHPN